MDKEELKSLNTGKLKNYIECRLKGETYLPSYYPDRDEEPEHFIIDSYKQIREESKKSGYDFNRFKGRIHTSLNILLKEEINNGINDPEYFSRLLYLTEFFDAKEVKNTLTPLFKDIKKYMGKKANYTSDLAWHIIRATTQFQKGEEFLPQLEELLGKEKYAPVAYTAILEIGLDCAVEHLSKFIDTSKKDVHLLRVVQFLFKLYEKDDVLKKLKSENLDEKIVKKVKNKNILKMIGEYLR
ncbi:MAG: hypothetical protein KJ623_00930 [Nanoarchaeota archaeon]|nr:hypothetical protein [Nanoarchaeota archaeon]MBU0962596.1 hypothetical protein [Nanoarchaeota archaeon]